MARFKFLILVLSLAFETAYAGGSITCVEAVSPESETKVKTEVAEAVVEKVETAPVADPLESLLTYRAKNDVQIQESASELLAKIQKRAEEETYGIYEVIVSEVIRAQIKGTLEEHAQIFNQFGTRDGVKKAQNAIKDMDVLIERAQGLITSISDQQEGKFLISSFFSSREGVIKKKAEEFKQCYSNLSACSLDLKKTLEDLTKAYKISQALIVKTQDEITVLADLKSRITDTDGQFFINKNIENLAQTLELLKVASKSIKDVVVSGKIQVDETVPDVFTSARRLVYAGAPESMLQLDTAEQAKTGEKGSLTSILNDIRSLQNSGVLKDKQIVIRLNDLADEKSSFSVDEFIRFFEAIPRGVEWGVKEASTVSDLIRQYNHGSFTKPAWTSMTIIAVMRALAKIKISTKQEKLIMMRTLGLVTQLLKSENSNNNFNDEYLAAIKSTMADIVLKASQNIE